MVRLTGADIQHCDCPCTFISHGGRLLRLDKVNKELQWLRQVVQTGILEKQNNDKKSDSTLLEEDH